MDLDSRAAEAAASLRDEVAVDLDVDAAYDGVLAGGGRRRARSSLGRGVVLAAAVVVVLAGLVAVAARAPSLDGSTDREMIGDGDPELSAAAAAILGGLPDGPLDGRESWRLPVIVAPQQGLREGDEVTLYGRGFQPGESVGAVHCGSEADTIGSGVGACDLGTEDATFANTTSGTARSDGTVVLTVTVRRHIDPPLGPIDCASAAERCILAIGAAADYDRSGGTYVNFAGAPPFPTPTFGIDPAGPHTPGQQVVATAGGLIPGRQAQILQCAGDDHCASLSQGRVADDGTYAATVAIGSSVLVEGEEWPCDGGCTLRFTGIGLPDATSSPLPEPIPLEILPGEAVVGAEPPSTTAPPTTEMPAVAPPSTEVEGPTTTTIGPSGEPTVTEPPLPPEEGSTTTAPVSTSTMPPTTTEPATTQPR